MFTSFVKWMFTVTLSDKWDCSIWMAALMAATMAGPLGSFVIELSNVGMMVRLKAELAMPQTARTDRNFSNEFFKLFFGFSNYTAD